MSTIQKEEGKSDIVSDGPGTSRQVPEGSADGTKTDGTKTGGHINGEPVSKEELERSTQGR